MSDLLESAWGIIANAGRGDWTKETQEWQEAAARWREEYHAFLKANPLPDEQPMTSSESQPRTAEGLNTPLRRWLRSARTRRQMAKALNGACTGQPGAFRDEDYQRMATTALNFLWTDAINQPHADPTWIEAEAAQDSRPLDVERLARLDRYFDETAWKEIPGFPPDDPELEHRQKAEWMVARLAEEPHD